MSYVMIATGTTRRAAHWLTLPCAWLWLGGALAASLLLGAGVGLGCRLSAPRASIAAVAPPAPAALPFALEQLGKLSGRLFKLESLARQLNEGLGTRPAPLPANDAAPSKARTGSGGPMLAPRPTTLQDLGALQLRIDEIERQIALADDASTQRALALMHLPTRSPLFDAELTSPFGNRGDPINGRRAFHAGLDFAAEYGSPIRAAAGGTVAFAGFRSDYGWMVEIDHGNGLSTRYAHASRLLVKPRSLVAPGEEIARLGSSGRSTGPHLHFEVLRHGEPIDPRRYLAAL